jgi:hypothetical protein
MEKFNFSKPEDQKKFEELPSEQKEQVVEDAREEAIKMVERIKRGQSKDYKEASMHLDNKKRHEEWLLELHEEREKDSETSDKQLFGFNWEDGGRFDLSKEDIDWLCQQIKQAGETNEFENFIYLDEREQEEIIEYLSGIYGSQDVYRIFSLLDKVFGKEAKNYNLGYGFGGKGTRLTLSNKKNEVQ